MDTMELTKIVGGLCAALLGLLLISWAAETIYHVGGSGHGDGHDQMAYVIETDDSGGDAVVVEAGPSIEELLATADVAKGEKVYGKCKACHKLEDGANGTGPHLFGVVGRPIGTVDGFAYSGALAERGGAWGPEELNGFLTKPKDWAPGTKMGFAGLKKDSDRANLIAYLQTIQ